MEAKHAVPIEIASQTKSSLIPQIDLGHAAANIYCLSPDLPGGLGIVGWLCVFVSDHLW
jgi:hypothetical protein